MDSNEHVTMEQNEEHLETNISIYYTHETELYAQSYDAMKYATEYENNRDLEKNRGEGKSTSGQIGSGARRS